VPRSSSQFGPEFISAEFKLLSVTKSEQSAPGTVGIGSILLVIRVVSRYSDIGIGGDHVA
jgi:hypothetical protein